MKRYVSIKKAKKKIKLSDIEQKQFEILIKDPEYMKKINNPSEEL